MAGADEKSAREDSGRDADQIRRRLDALGAELKEAQGRHGLGPGLPRQSPGPALGHALRLGMELVAGVAIGAFIGWALDRWLGTAPFLMVVFLTLGATAGIMNVVRTAKRMQADASALKDLPSVRDDDD